MIKSFRGKALKRFVDDGDPSKLSVRSLDRLAIMLRHLDTARKPQDLNLPGFFFHSLKGEEKGRFSIRVTGNYRLTFGWHNYDAIDVDLEDYH